MSRTTIVKDEDGTEWVINHNSDWSGDAYIKPRGPEFAGQPIPGFVIKNACRFELHHRRNERSKTVNEHQWHILIRRCTDYNKEESNNLLKCARCGISRYQHGSEFTKADGEKVPDDPGCASPMSDIEYVQRNLKRALGLDDKE